MKDKRIDAYIAASAPFAKPILTHLRGLVHKACPEVTETIKWGFPNFDYHGILCNMASFNQHCAFTFWKAKLMKDYEKVLRLAGNSAMGQFGQLKSLKDLPSDKKMIQYIKEAALLNETGVKPVRRPTVTVKNPLSIPTYFKKVLSGNKKAWATFDAFSYSHKKEYLEWITEAKTELTRNKRMAAAVLWLSEGKIRNWKYIRK